MLVPIMIGLAAAPSADACRYSVREVGFVNLDEAPYRFLLYPGDASPEHVARVKRAAYTAFIDAEVQIDEAETDYAGTNYRERHGIASYPAGVLVAPEGQSLPVIFTDEVLADDDAVLEELQSLVSSPLRDVLRAQVVEPFCTVLLIHGDDAKLNVTTKARVEYAIQELTDSMDQLEKATEEPPHLVELTATQRASEAALLWSLGLSPAELSQPRVAVLFGRARRMGSVLRGDRVTQESLVEIMKLIGASCECGLDRKWMQGPMLLMAWDSADQAELANHLGFDPESPLVKTEISQIIAQGMAVGATASAQSVMGIFEPAEKNATPEVVMEDVLVVEDVPLTGVDEVDEMDRMDVVTADADEGETAVAFSSTGDASYPVTRDVPLHDTYFVVEHFHYLYVLAGLFVLVNVAGAIYFYRKRARD